jgi:hypothetical protein
MSDLPSTAAKVFQYADDIAVTYQAKTFDKCENNLEADIKVLTQFFHRWCPQPSPGKTEMCVFHQNTHGANKQLDVMFNGTSIKHVDHPKYLGVTLDRTLTFKSHLETAAKKVSSRVNLVGKLAGTKWGSNAQTLRTASQALVYSSTEYCAPVWLNSAHVHKLDVQLNNVMRLITGTVKSTELQRLPVLSNIAPPKLRRKAALFWELKNSWINEKSLLFEQLQDVPALRLRSRNPIWIDDPGPTNTVYDLLELWREMWRNRFLIFIAF